ncbi:MAG: PQQ-binding-like beta-propeller repeat protein, partial [Planctomycetaceae bacterium]|nr:PQQ-binding-like beta-propeller repeat protein [Planctomycetaceae bacterium]
LGQILTAKSDHTFQPDRDIPLSRGLKAAAEEVVGNMPAAGREAYQLHFGAQAQRLLDEATEQGQTALLTRISHQFFHTAAGAEATYLLGTHYLDQNHPLRGAMYFQRLQQKSHHRRKYEPVLDVQMATCWALAGLPERAEQVLVQLKRKSPDVQLNVAGIRQGLFTQSGQALSWLADQIGPFARLAVRNSWPLFRGNSQRNQLSKGNIPYLKKTQWQVIEKTEYLEKQITTLRTSALAKRFPLLPSMQPLVVNETVLFRTPTELLAVARKTGELLWKSPFDDSLRHLVQHHAQPLDEVQQQSITRGLQRRLWNNPTFGTMSSDGQRVYSVEGLGFGDVQIQQRLVVMADGTQRLDPGHLKSYNTLASYDLTTGKTVWEIGGPQNLANQTLAGYFFLGPPLPFGGRLYAIGIEKKQTRLLELDAQTGSLVWQITLADSSLDDDPQARFKQSPFVLPLNQQFKSGATPSSSEGILVCPISDSSFVAVNLTTRSVLWIYDAGNHDTATAQRMINPFQAPMGGGAALDHSTTWADTTVTIAAGKVILTPQHSEKILCLDLVSGELRWSLPRGDGLYVAGVEDNKVIIVGRSHLSAVNLANGSNAWSTTQVEFPAGSVPSGRGYLSPGRFHLPLTTAEVAVFDLVAGRLQARSQSPNGIIPGNLVNCDNFIISQNTTGIYRFPSIAMKQQDVAQRLQDQGDNALLLAQSGEVLLYAGKIHAAVQALRKSLQIQPNENTSRLLAAAIVEGLRIDDDTFLGLAQELAPTLIKDQQNAAFLRQLIGIYQRSGNQRKAFEVCLQFMKIDPGLNIVEDIAGTRRVRRDRWLAARIDEIWQAADVPSQQVILQQLDSVIADIPRTEALSLFEFLPVVTDLYLQEAQAALENKNWIQAEAFFRQVWQHGNATQQRQAAAELARLYQQRSRPRLAADIYRLLASQYPDLPVIDGQTGTQLLATMSQDDKLKPWLSGDLAWPRKTPLQSETKRNNTSRYRLPVTLRQATGPLDPTINIDVDSQGRTLTALDDNAKQLWQVRLSTPKVSMPFMGPAYNHIQGQLDGNLLVAWMGNRICAIDGLDSTGKLLWDNPTWSVAGRQQARIPRPIFMGQRLAWQKDKLKATKPIPLAVSRSTVCYQKDGQLLAVDRLSGKTLWTRDGFTPKSDLFGDDHLLFVTSPDSNQATVLSTLDGRQLATRALPRKKDRMITLGRKILTWSSNDKETAWTLLDPWQQETVWQRSFAPATQPTLINTQTVAILEPNGHFLVQGVSDGTVLLENQVPKPKTFENIAVLEDRTRYFLAVNRNQDQANFIPSSSNSGRFVVNGELHAFDINSQKLNWTANIGPQLLTLDQSRNFPVLVFSVQTRKQNKDGRTTSAVDIHCVDKETGKDLYKKTNSYSNQLVGVEAKPAQQRVELKFRTTVVQLNYGTAATPAKPGATPGPPKEPAKAPEKIPASAEETPADRLRNLFRRAANPPPRLPPATPRKTSMP